MGVTWRIRRGNPQSLSSPSSQWCTASLSMTEQKKKKSSPCQLWLLLAEGTHLWLQNPCPFHFLSGSVNHLTDKFYESHFSGCDSPEHSQSGTLSRLACRISALHLRLQECQRMGSFLSYSQLPCSFANLTKVRLTSNLPLSFRTRTSHGELSHLMLPHRWCMSDYFDDVTRAGSASLASAAQLV